MTLRKKPSMRSYIWNVRDSNPPIGDLINVRKQDYLKIKIDLPGNFTRGVSRAKDQTIKLWGWAGFRSEARDLYLTFTGCVFRTKERSFNFSGDLQSLTDCLVINVISLTLLARGPTLDVRILILTSIDVPRAERIKQLWIIEKL